MGFCVFFFSRSQGFTFFPKLPGLAVAVRYQYIASDVFTSKLCLTYMMFPSYMSFSSQHVYCLDLLNVQVHSFDITSSLSLS